MTLEQLYFIGEIVATIAVIASLIYVGRQVKENTVATRATAAQAMAGTMNGYVGLINSSTNLADVLHRGATGMHKLQGGEIIQFGAFLDQMYINSEAVYYQWRDGVLDERLWDTYRHVIVDMMSQEGTRDWWQQRRHWFGDQFSTALEDLCSEIPAKPMHSAAVKA